jgi:hypothetical protein
MKYVVTLIALVIIAGGGYWYASRAGWFASTGPSNPPTAADRARMQEIDKSSATIAPNAVPGAGVRPVGSLPPPVLDTPAATGTEATGTATTS